MTCFFFFRLPLSVFRFPFSGFRFQISAFCTPHSAFKIALSIKGGLGQFESMNMSRTVVSSLGE
jgi:hypothetical protein